MFDNDKFDEAVKAIKHERQYQERVWPRSTKLPTTGEIMLIEDYLRQFKQHYQEEDDAPQHDVPEKCLHDLRKIGALVIRAMENSGAVRR